MPRLILLLTLLAFAPAMAARAADAPPTAIVDTGRLAGVREGDLVVFKGIPYAAPPVGDLRWRPPAAPAAWSGERKADEFGPICPQPKRPDGVAAAGAGQRQSEDCLYLNVWSFKAARRAPVMVWIHGGAFRFGSGGGRIYDGAAFARDGVVLVTLNYRLGALGFFAHPALTAEAGPDAPLANYGLMDQLAALRWVQRNIAAFGGDPGNVTVFGESAGGESILALLAAPSSRGLFARAIVESGGGWGPGKTLAAVEQQDVAIASAAGLGADATPAQLRALPVDKLFDANMTLGGYGPIVDGRLLKESIPAAFADGHALAVPLLIGSNSFEASLMTSFRIPPAAMLARAPPGVRQLYPAADDQAADALFTDSVMGAPARWIAAQQSQRAPTWLYHFSYVPTARRSVQTGAPHGGEIPFVFADWDALAGPTASPEDVAFEGQVHACWVAFATHGAPRCGGVDWPAYAAPDGALMELSPPIHTVKDFRAAQYDALQQLLLARSARLSSR